MTITTQGVRALAERNERGLLLIIGERGRAVCNLADGPEIIDRMEGRGDPPQRIEIRQPRNERRP